MIALTGVRLRSRATGAPVLDAVDLSLEAGEVALVMAGAGAGKSALVRLLCGVLAPEAGTVRVFDRDLARLRRGSLARLRRLLGVMLDDVLQLDDERALDNVALVLEIAGVGRRERELRAARALDRVGLATLATQPAGQLTSGERRRLALARAIVGQPRALLLDQPTADLDGEARGRVIALVSEHAAAGGAALIATSDPALFEAAVMLDWTVHELDGGRLQRVGETGRAAAGVGSGEGMVEAGSDSGTVDEGERGAVGGFRVPGPDVVRGARGTDAELLLEAADDPARADDAGKIVPFPSSARLGSGE